MKNQGHEYSSFQFTWFILIAIAVLLFVLYLFLSQAGSKPITLLPFILIELLFISMVALFYGMYTEINNKVISVKFGIGLIRRKIPIDQISSVEIVRNQLLDGIGINLISNGIIYSVHGFDAVELKLHTGKRVRIGSQEVNKLKYEIEKHL